MGHPQFHVHSACQAESQGPTENVQAISPNFQTLASQKRSVELLENSRDQQGTISIQTLLQFLNFATYVLSNNLLSGEQTKFFDGSATINSIRFLQP